MNAKQVDKPPTGRFHVSRIESVTNWPTAFRELPSLTTSGMHSSRGLPWGQVGVKTLRQGGFQPNEVVSIVFPDCWVPAGNREKNGKSFIQCQVNFMNPETKKVASGTPTQLYAEAETAVGHATPENARICFSSGGCRCSTIG